MISIYCILLNKDKYYPQLFLDNCVHKTVNTKMTDYLDDHLFDSNENNFFWFR